MFIYKSYNQMRMKAEKYLIGIVTLLEIVLQFWKILKHFFNQLYQKKIMKLNLIWPILF